MFTLLENHPTTRLSLKSAQRIWIEICPNVSILSKSDNDSTSAAVFAIQLLFKEPRRFSFSSFEQIVVAFWLDSK